MFARDIRQQSKGCAIQLKLVFIHCIIPENIWQFQEQFLVVRAKSLCNCKRFNMEA